jgi:hypothetical protein
MIWPSVISGLAAIVAASLGFIIRQKIKEVHVLVDGRLTEALEEIKELKASVKFEKTQEPEIPGTLDERGRHRRIV